MPSGKWCLKSSLSASWLFLLVSGNLWEHPCDRVPGGGTVCISTLRSGISFWVCAWNPFPSASLSAPPEVPLLRCWASGTVLYCYFSLFFPPLFLILFSKLSIGFLFLQFLNSGSCFCCSLKITCLSQLRLLCGCVISLGTWSSLLPVYRPFPPGGLRLVSWWRFPWLSVCL